jgi:hypothetical protein
VSDKHIDVQRLRQLLAAASARPWMYSRRDKCVTVGQIGLDGHVYDDYSFGLYDADVDDFEKWDNDAALICAVINVLPQILDAIERVEG